MNVPSGSIVSAYLPRLGVYHKGIVDGSYGFVDVIHNSKDAGKVVRSSLEHFREGQPVTIEWQPTTRDAQNAVLQRAISAIGRTKFSLLFSNCEDFVTWCRDGVANSETRNMLVFCAFLVAVGMIGLGSVRK